MPLFEYLCDTCGATKELIHKFDETPEVLCETCLVEEAVMSRVISTSMFILKGAGFHKNDYKRPPKYNEGGSDQ